MQAPQLPLWRCSAHLQRSHECKASLDVARLKPRRTDIPVAGDRRTPFDSCSRSDRYARSTRCGDPREMSAVDVTTVRCKNYFASIRRECGILELAVCRCDCNRPSALCRHRIEAHPAIHLGCKDKSIIGSPLEHCFARYSWR